jgi:hypothetical protein
MTYEKEVFKIDRDGRTTVEMKECHPQKLPERCRYVAPYWWQAFQNVSQYEKKRELQEVHKLVADNRVSKGLKLYRNKKILSNVVTRVNRGDVHATVESEDGTHTYTVIMKNYLAEKLPQYTHEREEYLADLYVDCTCPDHVMSHYRSNASMLCSHVCAVIWFLMDKFDMEKIFISPEEHVVGYDRSNTVELETEILGLPLVRFRQHLNILLLKKFRNMSTAMAISWHKIDNITNKDYTKPTWITFTERGELEKLMRGISRGYKEMSLECGEGEQYINERLCTLLGIKPQQIVVAESKTKKWYQFWR